MSPGIAKADAAEQVLGQLDDDVRPRDLKSRPSQRAIYLSADASRCHDGLACQLLGKAAAQL
jgi:hypothetical protein